MAELADAADSKSAGLRPLGVQFPLPAPSFPSPPRRESASAAVVLIVLSLRSTPLQVLASAGSLMLLMELGAKRPLSREAAPVAPHRNFVAKRLA